MVSARVDDVSRPARVVQVEPLGQLTIRVSFDDGLSRVLDLDPMIRGGLLEDVRHPDRFATICIDPVAGTVCWPNGIDLDPDVLHGDQAPATGSGPTLLSEHWLRTTG